MPPLLRRIGSVLLALAVALIIVFAIETVSAQVHPLPAGVDPTDPDSLKRALEAGQIPIVKLAVVLAGWLLAAYSGGAVAIRWSRWVPAVWVFAACFTAIVYRNLGSFPHPQWMWIGGLAGSPLFALGGGQQPLAVSRKY
jgi:hypothetical protein